MSNNNTNTTQTVGASTDLSTAEITRPTEFTSGSGMRTFIDFNNGNYSTSTDVTPDTDKFRHYFIDATARLAVMDVITSLSRTHSDAEAAKALESMWSFQSFVPKPDK